MPQIKTAFRGGDNNGRPGWFIGFGFDQDVVDRLKDKVPSADRRWDGESKLWWVAIEHESTLLAILPGFEVHLNQPQLL